MPVISTFYGIKITMYFDDVGEHNGPHFHAEYQGYRAVFSIPEGRLLGGRFPRRPLNFVQVWAEKHKEELMQNWKRAVIPLPLFSISPLQR